MSENALATQIDSAIIENVVVDGDLAKLPPDQRVNYYRGGCE